ncbi:MAG: PQQ-binding-like beta-propeller repeat protein [Planctomycetota bacterium]
MAFGNSNRAATLACCALSLCFVNVGLAAGGENQLADAQIERAGNDVRSGLEHTDELIEKGRWDDAVETLLRIIENHGDALIEVPVSGPASELGFAKFIRVSEYCQRKMASWHTETPEALAAARRRMDELAHQWYQEAIDTVDESVLNRIVEELLLSSHGDQALLRLGELVLERGNHRLARYYWESLSPRLRVPPPVAEVLGCRRGCDWWTALRRRPLDSSWPKIEEALQENISDVSWLAYPDTDISLAAVRARLVLVSLLQDDRKRAELEFELLQRLHPDEEGELAGQTGTYVDLVSDWMEESKSWPEAPDPPGWTTLGGCPARNGSAGEPLDVARRPAWQTVLPRLKDDRDLLASGRRRVGERADGLLGYHVAVSDGVGFVQQPGMIRAIEIATGNPAWRRGSAAQKPDEWSYGAIHRWSTDPSTVIPRRSAHAGVPRYGVTIKGDRLFARADAAWTGDGESPGSEGDGSRLIGLDLPTQKLIFEQTPPGGSGWEFESSPLATEARLFVSLRRRDAASAQVRVVCYAINTGRLAWQRDVVRGEAVGDVSFEMSNSALTLGDDTLYYNTNLGAVAALRVEDGRMEWICRYQRAGLRGGDPDYDDRHWGRDQTPCLLHKDLVIVAPADCNRIFALDAARGRVVWATAPGLAADAIHLVGVGEGHLLACGDYLYWIDIHSGKVNYQFPAVRTSLPDHAGPVPRGYGRAVLAGDQVFWPTYDSIYVFEQGSNQQVRQPIELQPLGLTGGNLVIVDDTLLIAGAEQLAALNPWGQGGARPDVGDDGDQ